MTAVRDTVSAEEWAVRVDLAACYRLLVRYGWEDLVFTHITMRVPGADDQFLINPYGLFFDEITASSLVKIDLSGTKVDDSPFPVNRAGFVIHSAIHAARHDARCVLQVRAQSGGGELIPLPKEVLDGAYAQAGATIRPRDRGQLIWPGLLRRLDRTDPSYRT